MSFMHHQTAFAPGNWQVEIDSVAPEEWEACLSWFDDANFYQTWAYGEVSWGGNQLSHLLLRQGKELVGMAQLRVIRVPVMGCGVAYLRWGPIWRRKGRAQDPRILTKLLEALRLEYVCGRKLHLRIVPNVFCGDALEKEMIQAFNQLGMAPAAGHAAYRTFILDLEPSLEVLRKNLDQKWRNQLNRSEKNGLTVMEGDDSQLYSIFKSIYRELKDRKAFDSTVDVTKFERIQEMLPSRQKMQILIAYKEGSPVSALVGSVVGETGIYLLGATSNEGLQHKGSYLLQWRMIQRLKERGCRYYDLGGINPERNPGVYHFKSGFRGKDKRHIGTFELSASRLSSWLVQVAEGRWRKRGAGGEKPSEGGSQAAVAGNAPARLVP